MLPNFFFFQITLVITNLPRLDGGSHSYGCVFVDTSDGTKNEFATTSAEVQFMRDRTNITCPTPEADMIPRPEEGKS